jgi:hypothetical protein
MGLGGPTLGREHRQNDRRRDRWAARAPQTELSAVAHYRRGNDDGCLRPCISGVHRAACRARGVSNASPRPAPRAARDRPVVRCSFARSHALLRHAHVARLPCSTAGRGSSSSPTSRREMLCGHARIEGRPVAVIANQRGIIKGSRASGRASAASSTPERREGGVLHRDGEPGAAPDPVRAGRERLHGRPRGGAVGHHPGRRPLRRGDGDGGGAQDRAHREPRVRGRLLRHGGQGSIPTSSSPGPPAAWASWKARRR